MMGYQSTERQSEDKEQVLKAWMYAFGPKAADISQERQVTVASRVVRFFGSH